MRQPLPLIVHQFSVDGPLILAELTGVYSSIMCAMKMSCPTINILMVVAITVSWASMRCSAFLSRSSAATSSTRPFSHSATSFAVSPKIVHDVHDALSNSLWNANYVMDPEFWQLSETDAALKSFYQKELLTSVEIKESTIPGAGLGLFAAQNIDAGCIVTLYPIHTMGINFFEGGGSEWVALDDTDQEYFMSCTDGGGPNYSLFLLGNRPEETDYDGSMIVDCNPNRPDVPGWVSHRINDGAIITENSEAGILNYLENSMKKQNTVISSFGPSPLLAAYTTIPVSKGDELFTSYGVSYWLDASFPKNEWIEKSDAIKAKEKLLFECYLFYCTSNFYEEESNALKAVFDEL